WLSIVPRAGFRATYYNETRDLGRTIFTPSSDPLTPDFLVPDNTSLFLDGDKTRTVFNAGVEASFKISRAWEEAQNSALGLDGLRHVIQPFTNFSWVSDPGVNPAAILQFDRVEPTTKLRPIAFPDYTTIDSQVPAFDKGFTEVNTTVAVQPMANLQLNVGHRYLNNNPFFQNSSLFTFGGYYRINDNWGFAVQEQYEATSGLLEQQRYAVY